MKKLLIASNNQGKLAELLALFAGLPFALVTPTDEGIGGTVLETGSTYAENAALKARTYAGLSGLLTLADDSGLEVDALGGEPGVHSSRYAGDGAGDAERIEFLLRKLEGVPWERRTARFRSTIAFARPNGEIEVCEGTCEGFIAFEPRGSNGFGYDPVFYLPERGCTMAELPPEVKNQVSHRARAAQQARRALEGWLGS